MIVKTDFQKTCMGKCKNLLTKYLKDDIIFALEGKAESYYHTEFSSTSVTIDIYIYEDEAGYMLNKKDWKIFEQPDYKTSDLLINAFLDHLEHSIKNIGDGL